MKHRRTRKDFVTVYAAGVTDMRYELQYLRDDINNLLIAIWGDPEPVAIWGDSLNYQY